MMWKWNMTLLCILVLISLVSNTYGEKHGNGLCDVTQWHTQLVEHVKNRRVDLRGWQASLLRKIQHLVEEYGDRKVVKPCTLLNTFYSYILEENDDAEPDFSELDIKNYKQNDMTSNSVEENPEENIDIQTSPSSVESNELEKDKIVDSNQGDQPETVVADDDGGVDEVSREETSEQQNDDNDDLDDMEEDPTDLSFLEDDDEEEEDLHQHFEADSSDNFESAAVSSDNSKTNSDNSDNSNDVADSSDISNSVADSSENSQTGTDSSDKAKTNSDNSDNSNTVADSSDISNSVADSSGNSQTGTDSSGNSQPGTDRSDNFNSGADNAGNSQPGADSSDNSQPGADSLDNSNSVSDSSDNVESNADNLDNSNSGADSSDNSKSGANISGSSESSADNSDNSKSGTDSSDNTKSSADSADNSESGADSSDNPESGADNSDNSESSADTSDNSESNTDNSSDNDISGADSSDNSESNADSSDNSKSNADISDNAVSGGDSSDNSESSANSLGDSESSGDSSDTSKSGADSSDNSESNTEILDNSKLNAKSSDNSKSGTASMQGTGESHEGDGERLQYNDNKNERVRQMEYNDNENGPKQTTDNNKSSERSGDETNESISGGNQDKVEDSLEKGVPSSDKNIPDFSSLFAQQEQQTTQKFDKLELNLVKLENTFLMESMKAKNDMISIHHVENHIMKLENNLYQLNQSYNQLQRDHSALKRKQKQQSSSLQMYHTKIKTCPIAKPKSENNFELITQQKSRMWELSQVVANQSLNIQQMQTKSTYLEEQNKHLFKVVMDQSALISNILSQIQEMNQRSTKTTLETSELRLLFNHAITKQKEEERSSDVVQELESGHTNEGDANEEFRRTVPDSAFMPLETPESNNMNDINFEQINRKKNLETSEENTRQIEMPPSEKEGDDEIAAASTSTSENVQSSSDHSDKTPKQHKDVPDAKTPDSSSTKNMEIDASNTLRSAESDSHSVEDKIVNSPKGGNKDRQSKKKTDDQKPITHHILYPSSGQGKPVDCYDLYKTHGFESGVDRVFVTGLSLSVSVKCEKAGGTGGWTTLLRRDGGQVDFYRNYEVYKEGFGAPRSEHYIGNEVVHYLTNQKHYSLRVDLTDWEGTTRHAFYDHFWIDNEDEHFKLHVHGYSGTAGDGLAKHNGMKFSTFDMDNDLLKKELGGSCAKRFKGAGWYYKCYQSNLMGVYYNDGIIPEKRYDGITWKPWKGPNYSMKTVTMSIRPREME